MIFLMLNHTRDVFKEENENFARKAILFDFFFNLIWKMKYEINYDDKWIRYTWWKIEIDEYRWLG